MMPQQQQMADVKPVQLPLSGNSCLCVADIVKVQYTFYFTLYIWQHQHKSTCEIPSD